MKKINWKKQLALFAGFMLMASLVFSGCDLLDDDWEDDDDDWGWLDEDWDDDDWDDWDDDDDWGGSGSSGNHGGSSANARFEEDEEYGEGTATVLIYIIGSDLESEGGCASEDIQEICRADLSEDVNVVIQTGGATAWSNRKIDAGTVQRFVVEDNDITLVDDLGRVSMVDPDTVTDFLKWGTSRYPAERTSVIFWDHGGGTLCGYGVDEYYPNDTLEVYEIAESFAKSGVHYDFIGFDACLMATVETAYALYPYADYLIASEETEPGTGWYYTGWLDALSKNPSASTPSIGSKIIQDFVDGPDASFYDSNTLAVIDLSKIPALHDELFAYLDNARDGLQGSGYQRISRARSNAKSYGDGEYDQIDIRDFVEKANLNNSNQLLSKLDDAVVCFDTNINNSYGLAMYFPFDYPDYYETMVDEFSYTGYANATYTGFFNDYLSIMVNGQVDVSVSPVANLTGYDMTSEVEYEDMDWYESSIETTVGQADFVITEYGELYLDEKGDGFVLSLSDDQWDLITYIELQVLIDDGEGMIDLGGDNVYEIDDDGDLVVDFDYTWVALDGQVVPFYAEEEGERSDGTWYTYGYTPATLVHNSDGSEEDIEILIYWDEQHNGGYVAGYRKNTGDGPGAYARNLSQFENGDELYFICDYYTYDGDYDDSYYFGEALTVRGDIEVSYEEVGEYTTWVYYYVKDIYQNEYYTETIEISF